MLDEGRHVQGARLPSLTGLRFLAAATVFLSHVAPLVPAAARDAYDAVAEQGAVGVSFFFILSGFVLRWSRQPQDRPRAFYRRRYARIAPVYLVGLGVGVAAQLTLGQAPAAAYLRDALPSLLALQAWSPSPSVFFGGNAAGWSISVEAFFYAVFPALMLVRPAVWQRQVPLGLALLTVVVAPAVLLQPGSTQDGAAGWALYVFPLQRLAEFVAGVALADHVRRGGRSPLSLGQAGLLAALAYLLAGAVPYWAMVVLTTFVPFCLLILAAADADLHGAPSRLRRRGWVVLGEWSFAFYLLHQPVILVVLELAPARPAALVACAVAAFALSVACAGLVYRFVERPAEVRLRGARPRPEMSAASRSEPVEASRAAR